MGRGITGARAAPPPGRPTVARAAASVADVRAELIGLWLRLWAGEPLTHRDVPELPASVYEGGTLGDARRLLLGTLSDPRTRALENEARVVAVRRRLASLPPPVPEPEEVDPVRHVRLDLLLGEIAAGDPQGLTAASLWPARAIDGHGRHTTLTGASASHRVTTGRLGDLALAYASGIGVRVAWLAHGSGAQHHIDPCAVWIERASLRTAPGEAEVASLGDGLEDLLLAAAFLAEHQVRYARTRTRRWGATALTLELRQRIKKLPKRGHSRVLQAAATDVADALSIRGLLQGVQGVPDDLPVHWIPLVSRGGRRMHIDIETIECAYLDPEDPGAVPIDVATYAALRQNWERVRELRSAQYYVRRGELLLPLRYLGTDRTQWEDIDTGPVVPRRFLADTVLRWTTRTP